MPLQKAACWQPPATAVSRNMLQPDALGACGRLLRRDMCCWPFDFRQAACSTAVVSMHCCDSVHINACKSIVRTWARCCQTVEFVHKDKPRSL